MQNPGNGPAAQRARRDLLRFVLQSPLLWGGAAALPLRAWARPELAVPANAGEAIDVFQIERLARTKLDLPTIHFIVNGADDGKTMQANRDAFDAWADPRAAPDRRQPHRHEQRRSSARSSTCR